MSNFNGTFGCNICEIETKPCKKIPGKRTCRAYHYSNEDSELRTGERMKRQARQVLDLVDAENKPIKGVKGETVIAKVPLFDLGTCELPEYICIVHC